MRFQQTVWIVVLVAMGAVGCRKEEDVSAPTVTIVVPGSSHSLAVPDTLRITADVSSDQALDRITFSVAGANGVPIVPSVSVGQGSMGGRFEVRMAFTSPTLPPGTYTLTVQAVAGDGSGKDFRTIHLTGEPLRMRRVFAIAQPDAGTTVIHAIDSTGALSVVNTLVMDLGGAAVSSIAQTLAVMGSVNGPLMGFAADGQTVRWLKPNGGASGIPWFVALDRCADGLFHVGTTDGYSRAYNPTTGNTEVVCSAGNGFRPKVKALIGSRLAQAETDVTGTTWRLALYEASSGVYIGEQPMDKKCIALHPRDDVHLLVFGTRNGQGVVEDRDVQNGGGWEPRTWPAAITCVERVDANTFLVGLENGTIERFTWSNAGSLLVANLPDVQHMSVDPVSGLVYVAAGENVYLLDQQNGQFTATWAIGAPVKYALPLFNR